MCAENNMSNKEPQRNYKTGDIIMHQGDDGESAYIIEDGLVEIIIERPDKSQHVVGTRGAGAIIGEMSLVDNAPRTATIKAIEDCQLLEITKDDFSRRLDSADPVLRMTIQVIMTRYRDTLTRAEIRGEKKHWPPAEIVELGYTEETDAVESIRIGNDFKEALKKGEISLHYQPIINMEEGRIMGFEALMRWIHPEKGFISPAVFIPIIEDNGLIVEASKWAFKESCMALKRIENLTGYHSDLHMSVNFSSTDFSSEDFVENIYSTISESDVTPKQIHLEITERVLMQQPDNARETLEMCRKAGMGISIDDFGTGYSSLSYLHYFPINTLKIDQSFIREMHKNESTMELVKSIISLGNNLKMTIVAEGVETLEEAKVLKILGCQLAQGYYFAKPMPEKDVTELVASWEAVDL
jgi:EAL domain-containing protein (putative c-di-GMP-specific phosphodiesterase class I)